MFKIRIFNSKFQNEICIGYFGQPKHGYSIFWFKQKVSEKILNFKIFCKKKDLSKRNSPPKENDHQISYIYYTLSECMYCLCDKKAESLSFVTYQVHSVEILSKVNSSYYKVCYFLNTFSIYLTPAKRHSFRVVSSVQSAKSGYFGLSWER